MKKYIYFLSLISIMISSCAIDDDIPIDPCQDEFVGSFDLLPTSDEVFPYFDLPITSKVIFVNEVGEEAIYQIGFPVSLKVTSNIPKPCAENLDFNINYSYETDYKGLQFESDENSISFSLNLSARIDFDDPAAGRVSDVFTIFGHDKENDTGTRFGIFSMVADQRTSTNDLPGPRYYESLQFLNRTFTDVYISETLNPFTTLYYTKEQGIVSFRDVDDVLWALDRIE